MWLDGQGNRRLQLTLGELDLVTGILRSAHGTARLTELERGLLAYLYERRGRIVGRDELLEQVWGYRPGVQSHTLETTIQRLRSKIERNVRSPEHLLNVRGRGYRLAVREPATAPSTDGVGLLEPIFGRDEAISEVGAWMAAGVRLVTVTGPPGIGKTWLAREVLGRLRTSEHRPERVFVDLGDRRTPAALVDATTAALGVPPDSRALRSMPAVWVLDDAQQLDTRAADQIRRWLQRDPDLTVIATSHARLGIEGERVLPLELLSVEAAVLLLGSRLRALGTPDPGPAVLESLARRTERLPLLLDGIAASLDGDPDDIDLQRVLDLIPARRTGGARTLREAVASAVGRLDRPLARSLAELAVFRGPFGSDAAAAVLTGGAGGALLELCRRSLARRLPDGRFALYEAVRACLSDAR